LAQTFTTHDDNHDEGFFGRIKDAFGL
jgi:hypothetical protein